MTSRPGANAETLERFENYHVCKLSATQVFEFIDKQLGNGSEEDKELAVKIKDLLNQSKRNPFMRYMSSPLLLSMFILTYNEHPELPKHVSSFYYNVLIHYTPSMMRRARLVVINMTRNQNSVKMK